MKDESVTGDRYKVKCVSSGCDWKGYSTDLLSAENPFNADNTIYGCPYCKSVNSEMVACDEWGCWEQASCGTPMPDGYRTTCHEHKPIEATESATPSNSMG